MTTKYTKFEYSGLSRFDVDDTFEYVKLPYSNDGGSSASKVLFVLDYMPSEDLESGKLLSGVTGDLLGNLLQYTRKVFGKGSRQINWMGVSFNAFRTAGKSSEFQSQAHEAFAERIHKLIVAYKPDYVVAFGRGPMDALLGDKIVSDDKGRKRYSHWFGNPVQRSFKTKSGEVTTKVVSNMSLYDVIRASSAGAGVLGYMCRWLAPIYGFSYQVDGKRLENHKSSVIETLHGFKKLMKRLRAYSGPVSIDTETKNLHKVTNKLYTIQFAVTQDEAFLLPLYHKDTPFTPSELEYIVSDLKAFFEDNNNDFHIYVNAKFDLTQLRDQLGVDYYCTDVVDILGEMFALDENGKFIETVCGEYEYSLGNLSVQYGFEGYLNAEFGKANRKNFGDADLTNPAVIRYCGYDVVTPLAIHEQNIKIAAAIGYTKWLQVVRWEIGDTIHAFTELEHTGALVDIPYLFYLRTPDSPIENVIKQQEATLLSTPAAKKANSLVVQNRGGTTDSLWGNAYTAPTMLKLNTVEGKQALFFDVLKLKPLEFGAADRKTGEKRGKIDKIFQKTYASVPEVAAFTALEKAKKLRNAYVRSFIRLLGESEDFSVTKRIRPNYSYLKVVTHRGSAADPNLQQVPSHSELGKHIKRLFVAREGCLYVKVDYKAHEVRGWGIVSFDKAIAALFQHATDLYNEYRVRPTPELKKRLKSEADIHRINAGYFFGMNPGDVDGDTRSAVKSVIFGVIYQKSAKSLAKDLKRELEFMKDLVEKLFKRFSNGKRWIEATKKHARAHMFVEAPIGIRRNLFGYLMPASHPDAERIWGEMDRRAVNSPIQGMCSKFMMNGCRIITAVRSKIQEKRKDFELWLTNSVHDSLENEASYKSFIKSIAVIEWCLTEGVKKKVKDRHNFDLISTPEVDFEIGASLSQCHAWDFSVWQLERLVVDSLLFQRNQLGRKIDVDKVHDLIFDQVPEDAPDWMLEQVKNLDYKFDLTEKRYIAELKADGEAQIANLREDYKKAKDEEAKKKIKASSAEPKGMIAYAAELEEFRVKSRKKS